MQKKILYCFISLILFSIPWFGGPGYFLFGAFVPLLLIQEEFAAPKKKGIKGSFFLYYALTFLCWNIVNVYWIKNAVWVGAIAAIIINTILMAVPFMIYHYVWKRAGRALAYTILVTGWISAEYAYLHGQISFPWILLGNGFANNVGIIQWYEYTGLFGGGLWVLVMNLLIFEAVKKYRRAKNIRHFILPAAVAVVPVIVSLIIYYRYKETENPITVEVIQPNIFEEEKFMTMSQREQIKTILNLAGNAPGDVDFIVTPETSVDNGIWENDILHDRTIAQFKRFLFDKYPNASFVLGATTYRWYNEEDKTITARKRKNFDYPLDAFNTALFIDTTDFIDIYHKSKLVIGAETMPFYENLKSLEKFSLDLGGFTGLMGKGQERSVFVKSEDKKIGVAICYESIYGEYCSEYIENGAEALFVITNDSWWGNTAGHRQHFSFARLRAVELRRSIARSANTGISGFINQRGDVISRTKWNERTSQTGVINLNDKITFYAKYGDMAGRLCGYVFLLSALYYIAYIRRKKDHVVD
ncbi:MAG: apolipoprotein N-acyltransferase [Rikenellaceae bacterium]|nr:apolipoprotein N-acyltransferase [Rikenellaceae bacterium]